MTGQLPISSLIDVTINFGATVAQAQNLTNLLVLGTSDIIDVTQRIRTYTSLDGVIADFGTSLPEYNAAQVWFAQTPTPPTISIGKWAKTDTSAKLIGSALSPINQALTTWTPITNGGFALTINGTSFVVLDLNFSGQTNLNGVASVINTGLTAVSANASIVWEANYEQFVLTDNSTGTSSTLTFLISPGSGTDISGLLGMTSTSSGAYIVNGIAAESALTAVSLLDLDYGQKWYALFTIGTSDTDIVAIADYIESANNAHFLFVNTQESGVLSSVDTSDVAYQLAQLDLYHTGTQYSSTSSYAVNSLAAKMLSVDYTGSNTCITGMYKQEPTISGENINSQQLASIVAKNCNVYANYNDNISIIQPGVTASGQFIDTVIGADNLKIAVQNAVLNLELALGKIPQTDKGIGMVIGVITNVLEQFVTNGFIAPGIWSNAGFGNIVTGQYLVTGYYIWAPKVASQSSALRSARIAVPIQIAAVTAGAIQYANISISLVS